MRRVAAIGLFLGACVSPGPAQACSIVLSREPTPFERQTEAKRLIEQATVIADGEVVRPLDNGSPALVYVYRTLKGPAHEWLQVGERHSCDVALQKPGERLRLILVGGPDIYFLPVDYSNARAEDRILRSDRRKDWPYRDALDKGADR